MAVSLTDLPAGHVFEPIVLRLSPGKSRAYRDAVGDALNHYDQSGVVPPLAVAALALGALLEKVSLPPGTLHASESLRFRAMVPVGASVACRATLAQRSVRAGWIVSVLDSEITCEGRAAVFARATVLSPAS